MGQVWDWPRLPPTFEATRRDRSWEQGAATYVDLELGAGRFFAAIDHTRYRVARVLLERYGVPPDRGGRGFRTPGNLSPSAAALVRTARKLDRAAVFAERAESGENHGFGERRRLDAAEAARALFGEVLGELETTLPPLEDGL